MMKLILAATMLTASAAAFADGHDHAMTISDVHAATKIALDEFAVNSPDSADKIYAFQGTIAGSDAAVKLFVKNGTETIKVNYTCHKHETELECHLQGE
jgi:hypothetical protein